MSRTSRVRALLFTALLAAAGCQDYNFNPVGECLIKPNLKQVTLSDISTADVLFVVDDSGSMGGEQSKLSAEFDKFINNLDLTNQNRVAQKLAPIDFHVAITTTSVFDNKLDPNNPVCSDSCPSTAGGTVAGKVCCKTSGTTPIGPLLGVQKCSGAGDDAVCPSGTTCQNDCNTFHGEWACCDSSQVPKRTATVSCDTLGAQCGDVFTHYRSDPSCTLGNAIDGDPYPQGRLVAKAGNPKVIHFDKQLYQCDSPPCAGATNKEGYGVEALKTFFKENVMVGTCGSNQESGLDAARRAVEYWLAQPVPDDTNTDREFIHRNSKLVLVFVGDEDDCSSPEDASKGVILTYAAGHENEPLFDSCVNDAEGRRTAVLDYTTYFSKLTGDAMHDRPVGGAFIVSAKKANTSSCVNGVCTSDSCVDEACTADICCDTSCDATCSLTSNTCGGQSPGSRFLDAAANMRSNEADVVAGSICDNFGSILIRIAEIVKPPTGLLLPSQPAGSEVTVLRIVSTSGSTRLTCNGPAPATLDAAAAAGPASEACPGCPYDWWFTASREQLTADQKHPTAPSKFIYINHDTKACEAVQGETYSAEYMGRLPDAGCSGTGASDDEARAAADQNCVDMLGGDPGEWTCFAGVDDSGVCVVPTGGVVGSCLCGTRFVPSADGSMPGTGICPNN